MTTHSLTATGYSQTATVGGYITYPSISGNYATTPDAAALDIVGDITIVVRIRPTVAAPAVGRAIFSKFGPDPNKAYMLRLHTTGGVIFTWTSGGTGATQLSMATGKPPTAVDVGWQWHAFTFDVDNGSSQRVARGWYSADGGVASPWTITTTVTTAGTTSIFSGAAVPHIGSDVGGAGLLFDGDIAYVSIRDGIGASGIPGGTEVFRFDGAVDTYGVAPAATSFVAGTGQTVTVFHSGGTPAVIVPVVPGAAVAIEMPLASTGTGTSTGSAALVIAVPLSATGTGTSAGSAAMLVAATLGTTGTGASTGSAALVIAVPVTATGTGTSTGSAALAASMPLTATGSDVSAGTAGIGIPMPVTATGTGTSTGSADILVSKELAATGTGMSTGTAALVAALTLATIGTGSSTGAAAIARLLTLSATGTGMSSGSAVFYFLAVSATSTGTITTTGSSGTIRTLASVGAITTTEVA